MRRICVLLLYLGPVLTLVCCNSQPPPVPSSDIGLHLLVEAPDGLTRKRPGWDSFLPITFGETLNREDLLQNTSSTEGLIVCSDLSLVSMPSGYHGGLPCSDKVLLVRDESRIADPKRQTASQVISSIPYILTPRHTFIQTTSPLLRWHPTGDSSTSYTVRVQGDTLNWWMETTNTELDYPQDAPSLVPKEPYRLIVEDSNGHSSSEEETSLDLHFALLSPEEIATVQSLLMRVQGLDIDERAMHLLKAEINASYKLCADAIILLEKLTANEDAPAIHRRLGDLYQEVGLYTEARISYEHALEGYRTLGDQAGEAATLVGLGLAYRGNLDDATARKYLERALDVYRTIGDAYNVANIEAILAKMEATK